MKRLLSLILCVALLTSIFSGCAKASPAETTTPDVTTAVTSTVTVPQEEVPETTVAPETTVPEDTIPAFTGLSDPDLLTYVEDTVYTQLVTELDSDDYFVENVEATFISEEYLSELSYNSQANIYFGYTLAELDSLFQGDRYVFTLGDDGQTTVRKMEVLEDTAYEDALKNIAIGTGIILVCVTISAVSAGVGAPAACMIFAASAAGGSIMALEMGGLSALSAGLLALYQTEDPQVALNAAALKGSESFKYGAIIGSINNGLGMGCALKGATLNGLSMNEAAKIQMSTKWPLDAIKCIHSPAEAKIYQDANLIPTRLPDGSWGFLRKIDWKLVDDFGRSNVQRIKQGLAPIDSTGFPYELHHIGQKADSPLAILSQTEHHRSGNFATLHYQETGKQISDQAWKAQKKEFWTSVLELAQRG